MSDELAFSANAEYISEQYERWKQDPASVSRDFQTFFQGFDFARSCDTTDGQQAKHLQSEVDALIYHYRALGHRIAQINPLGGDLASHPQLELAHFGLTPEHMNITFDTEQIPGIEEATLAQILELMRETYCGCIGVEYMHIQEPAERRWLQERMETSRNKPALSGAQRMRILWKLKKAELFEHFMHTTYRGQKRFSLEGSETTIPAMDYMVEKCPALGIEEIVIGMAHRGRLNVLANIVEKSYNEIFAEFEDNFILDTTYGDGDVKYHKGYSNDVLTASGKKIHISLSDNPSHLEMVGPVVEGKVRAKQAERNDTQRHRVLPFLMHGDAAFAGQGMVAENLNLSQLKGYRTGGTIHFIINNQVGFTTTAQDYLSGLYCTDVAKMVAIPIFHVNGDKPEAVIHCMDIALDYRQKFGKDVVIDMWCYRRHGHNEGDEPSFTQPLLYEKIAKHATVAQIYSKEMSQAGRISPDETGRVAVQFEAKLEDARKLAHEHPASSRNGSTMGGRWTGLCADYSHDPVETGANEDHLLRVAQAVIEIPEGFNAHRKVVKLMQDFSQTVRNRSNLQWAAAEALAFGSLLLEGTGVRLSGEDSRRGTFSQRHAVLYDQNTGAQFIPLTRLAPDQPQFCVYDSSLAEQSVLAFDYGYSLADPYRLICWEAQFGDFSNGAQVIIDQFIAAGISKWGRMSGLVMLLPHGYEGQGPEHSNAWLRRYLSLCAEENMQVINATTPAQYFHALRRQIKRNFRRPLIVMTPKSLLRNSRCVSAFEEFTQGHFHEILDDTREIARPKRVVFCSGKVYYDLLAASEEMGIRDVPIVRVEQFYPINDAAWDEIAERYADAREWVWVSEEPTNFGAWPFMLANMSTFFDGPIWYVGRARSASPATASLSVHKRQQKHIVEVALSGRDLEPELVDGVAVFTRGEELWHLKSRSRRLANPSASARSQNG